MKHTWKIVLVLVMFFFVAQVVGLAVTYNYIDIEKSKLEGGLVSEELPYGIERPEVGGGSLLLLIVGAILVGTIILLILIKFKFGIFWKLWYFLAVFITLAIAFYSFFKPNPWIPGFLALGLALWKILKPNIYIQNATEIFIYGGLAAIFVLIENFTVGIAIILLLLISTYDIYAVWKSKHMIKLAKFQAKSKVFAGLFVPYKLPKIGKRKKTKKTKGKAVKKMVEIKMAVLGGGDIGFPLIFAGVVMKDLIIKNFNPLWILIIPVVVSAALLILLIKGQKDKFYPAMPFLTIGCLVGYALILLV